MSDGPKDQEGLFVLRRLAAGCPGVTIPTYTSLSSQQLQPKKKKKKSNHHIFINFPLSSPTRDDQIQHHQQFLHLKPEKNKPEGKRNV